MADSKQRNNTVPHTMATNNPMTPMHGGSEYWADPNQSYRFPLKVAGEAPEEMYEKQGPYYEGISHRGPSFADHLSQPVQPTRQNQFLCEQMNKVPADSGEAFRYPFTLSEKPDPRFSLDNLLNAKVRYENWVESTKNSEHNFRTYEKVARTMSEALFKIGLNMTGRTRPESGEEEWVSEKKEEKQGKREKSEAKNYHEENIKLYDDIANEEEKLRLAKRERRKVYKIMAEAFDYAARETKAATPLTQDDAWFSYLEHLLGIDAELRAAQTLVVKAARECWETRFRIGAARAEAKLNKAEEFTVESDLGDVSMTDTSSSKIKKLRRPGQISDSGSETDES